MDGNKRRQAIIDILKNSLQPVSGTYLAKTLQVSRQVIVQDIALLRAGDYDIYSTHKGYVLNTQKVCKRIFKVHHDDNEVETICNIGSPERRNYYDFKFSSFLADKTVAINCFHLKGIFPR